MPVMRIRIVRVGMRERFVAMVMGMPGAPCHRLVVIMLVMLVMHMRVLMLQRFMRMDVAVPFRQV